MGTSPTRIAAKGLLACRMSQDCKLPSELGNIFKIHVHWQSILCYWPLKMWLGWRGLRQRLVASYLAFNVWTIVPDFKSQILAPIRVPTRKHKWKVRSPPSSFALSCLQLKMEMFLWNQMINSDILVSSQNFLPPTETETWIVLKLCRPIYLRPSYSCQLNQVSRRFE